jgi:hypothetical protein
LVAVTSDGIFCDDVDMKHMPNGRIIFLAVAVDLTGDTPCAKQIIHGLRRTPQEIVARSGDVGRGEVLGNGTQHIQSGIIRTQFSAQIV